MITVRNLNFSYTGAPAPALRAIDFTIGNGEIFGLLGPSGAGKSTTQKLLIGLLRGYSGAIEVLGRDLASWGSDYYERIGVAFELPTHFQKLSALENLVYFQSLYRRPGHKPAEVLEWVGLADDANLPVAKFSKGMQNRLSVARALLHDPQLLFFDEPTSGLDPANARRIKQLIRAQRAAGKTIFLTTHTMALAEELCDRVAFMVDGQIALIDTPRALRLRYGAPLVRVEYQQATQLQRAEFALAGLGENRSFLDLLGSKQIQTIHSQEASLDDIFVRVTGRGLG